MYKFFIERPIVSMVISIIMVIVGAVAVLGLPTAQFPNIADPQIQVNATYVGADALTVEQSVATPIEQQMSGVDNMEYMYSLNANNGTAKLTVDFNIKTDPNTDQILTQMRQSQAASQLPAAVNNFGVTVQKSTAAPMMLFDLYSPTGTYDSRFLANYSFINLVDGLTQVPAWQRLHIRRGTICDSHLDKAGSTSEAANHGAGYYQRRSNPEQCESRGPDRRRARSAWTGVYLRSTRTGATNYGSRIRKCRHTGKIGWLVGSIEGCRKSGAWRPSLQH